MENGQLTQGTLKFYSGKVVARMEEAIPYACGPEAQAVSNFENAEVHATNGGKSYSYNGRAHAYDGAQAHTYGGKAFGWTHDTEAHADGEGSSAYGFALDTKLFVTKGGKAFSDIPGVRVFRDNKADRIYKASPTVLQEEAPPYCSNPFYYDYRVYKNYVSRLDVLARAGVADAAFKLGMMPNGELRDSFTGNPRVFYLTKAYDLGRQDAAYQLGKYYMQRDKVVHKTADLWSALNWYSIAQREMTAVPADLQQEMDFIKSKLGFSDAQQHSPDATILPGIDTPQTNTNTNSNS